MKKTVLFFTAVILMGVYACEIKKEVENAEPEAVTETDNVYDSVKAQKYGADSYGMRKYVMAFLKKGPNRTADSVEAAKLQAAHMANIGKMAEAGKLALAGPFFGNDELRGIYIFNVETIEEAEALTNSDPAIQAGSLEMDLKEWYGSAALMMINEVHPTLAKESF